MKLYAPKYYKEFKCIADKCLHSCCVGWEIDIDEKTLDKYRNSTHEYAKEILKSIDFDGSAHFRLCRGDRCPHLDENGLCRIILNTNEDYLCDICREHPRFYNYTSVAEVGIGLSCMEAARVILSSADYDVFEEIGEVDVQADVTDFDGLAWRDSIYAILKSNGDYNTRLEKIREEFKIDLFEDSRCLEIINSLEYLDNSHKELFLSYSSTKRPHWCDDYLERALAYFIYRHCTEAFDEADFYSRLGFCLFCESLLASIICFKNAKSIEEITSLASIISEEIEYSEDNTESIMLEFSLL